MASNPSELADAPVAPAGAPRRPRGGAWRNYARLDRLILPLSFLVMIAIFAIAEPDSFFTTENAEAVLEQAVVLAVIGVGLTVVLASGDFDLSFPATVGLSGTAAVYSMAEYDQGVVVAVLVAIVVGMLVGALNGWLIAYLGGNAFIITLGMGTAVGGLDLAILKGETIYEGISAKYLDLALTDLVFGLTLFVILSWVIVALVWTLTESTGFGRAIHAIGSNQAAAFNAGIHVKRKRFLAFVLMGACAGIAGVIITSRAQSAFANAGGGVLIAPYAAAFLGAALTRRKFHPGATYLGVIYMGVLATGLTMTGQEAWVTNVITGAVLIVAVVLSGQTIRRPDWLNRIFPKKPDGEAPEGPGPERESNPSPAS